MDPRGRRAGRRRLHLCNLALSSHVSATRYCRDLQAFPISLLAAIRPAPLGCRPTRKLQKSGGYTPQAGRGDYCAREGRSAFPAGGTPRRYWNHGAPARSIAILHPKGLGVSLVAVLWEAETMGSPIAIEPG